LYVLQGLNYLIPLAVLPYLIRVLGIETYGLIAFCQSFALYFVLLTDYGFNFSATRYIAQHRNDPEAISSIFFRVLFIKIGLMVLGLIVLAGIIEVVPRFHEDAVFFLVAYLAVLGNVLLPQWYFQGVEEMRLISLVSGTAKALSAGLLFIVVRQPGDGLMALAIQSSGFVVSGVMGLWIASRKVRLRLEWPKLSELRETLSDGWHLFVSMAAVSLYTNTNVFMVGLLAGNTQAGYFSAAEKLVRGGQGILTPIMQAMFPHVSSLRTKSKELVIDFLRKSLLLVGGLSLAGSLAILLLAQRAAIALFGPQSLGCVPTLRWIALLPFIIALSNVLGIQTMIPFGLDKQFSRILIISGLVNVCAAIPLIHLYGSQGAGAAVLGTEILVTTLMVIVLERKNIAIFPLRKLTA
jgi:PST family polysaccharide transporter